MPTGITCVLCGEPASREGVSGTSLYTVICQVCGKYVSEELNDRGFQRLTSDERAMLSAYTRELFEYDSPTPDLNVLDNEEQVPRIIERFKNKTVQEKLNNLLLYIGRRSDYFGRPLHIQKEKDYPLTYSRNRDEFHNIRQQAFDAGFLRLPSSGGNVMMTWEGWERFEQIRETAEPSKKCFVAMPCADELREAYEAGIKPAIEDIPYIPVFIEKSEHNEKICDLVLAEIRGSKFVVADVTLQKQNVYYEAGFAQGLGKDVIWTCRLDDIQNAHFDTRQYNHILWSTPGELRKKLVNRIKATIL